MLLTINIVIICITIIGCVYLWLNYINPYSEEIDEGLSMNVKTENGHYYKQILHIKRTYKNGKVRYIRRESNI